MISKAPFLGLHLRVEAVEILALCDIALHGGDIFANGRHGLVEFRLPAAGDEDICTLFHKLLRDGEANAAAAARYHCDFSVEFDMVFIS